MASTRASWFKRNVLFRTPLYRKAACGNFHAVWDRLCFCNLNEHGIVADGIEWHGGVRDLETGKEYLPYAEPVRHHDDSPCFCEACMKMHRLTGSGRIMTQMDREVLSDMMRHVARTGKLAMVDELPQSGYAKYERGEVGMPVARTDDCVQQVVAFMDHDYRKPEDAAETTRLTGLGDDSGAVEGGMPDVFNKKNENGA